jgi:hypothetical protein
MNAKRILCLIITAPVWIPLGIFASIILTIASLIRYGFEGKWNWDWKP